jgi:hypothetical protein
MQTQRFMDIPKLLIDLEFLDLIPAASPDEKARLEKSILEEGCRDALVAWGDILLDGHKRKEICEKHGKEYAIVQRSFEDRDQAKLWIVRNQLGRRNLTPKQTQILIGTEYNLEKKGIGERGPEKRGQNDPSFKTAEIIARRHGISPRTVKRAGRAAEKIASLPPEERAAILSGQVKKRKKEVGEQAQETNQQTEGETKPQLKPDSDVLFNLKLLWDRATKSDRNKFLKWVQKGGNIHG